MRGKMTSFPICAQSRRQTCVSTSTTEAELTAAQSAAQKHGLPALAFWQEICARAKVSKPCCHVMLDNQAMIEIMRTGRNLTMRHLSKTHCISVASLHEQYIKDDMNVCYITTTQMAADLHTKPFADKFKWQQLCELNNLFASAPSERRWEYFDKALELHQWAHHVSETRSTERRMQTVSEWTFPPGWEHLRTQFGWQVDGERLIHIAREPKLYRVPDDEAWDIRSTWVKTTS